MIKNFCNYIVTNFGFNGVEDFYSSTIHHNFTILTIPIALISSIIQNVTGLQYLTLLSFAVLILMEFITGIYASKIKNLPIESRRFSRFGLKLMVWISLIFIINSLKLEYSGKTDITSLMAAALFSWLHSALFVYINLEYLISVLENLEVINGTDSATSKLGLIKKKLSTFIDKLLS